ASSPRAGVWGPSPRRTPRRQYGPRAASEVHWGCSTSMMRPVDLKDDDLWNLMLACSLGGLDQVKGLIERRPELVRGEYDYTVPLHFAVREDHFEVARFLLERGADPTYQTHPFFDSLLTMAEDREYHDLARFLQDILSRQFPVTEGVAGLLE